MTEQVLPGSVPASGDPEEESALAVFRNRPFLLLWLSQVFTQIGGNMVLYGLTVIVLEATRSNTAVSFLILTFLVPAVIFSAVAGVFVDRIDKRWVLVITNVLRFAGFIALYLVGASLPLILLLNVAISTVTVFFSPAEAAMIPQVVPRRQLITANGVFTLTLNAAFALGFALLGPVVVTLAGAPALILFVAVCYLIAAGFCWTLPASPPAPGSAGGTQAGIHDAEEAVDSVLAQLREGLAFIRATPKVKWSLLYLGIAASLVGVLGVIGPNFARDALQLEPKDFVVIVLPLGLGIVLGILVLNNYGQHFPRRRLIEGGLVTLGVLLALLAGAGPLSRLLQRAETATGLTSLEGFTSLLAIVVLVAALAGIAYAFVAIPAQTQLQEDIPEEVRGRVFGVLNMLVSVASFAPIIIVGPVADAIGNVNVLFLVAVAVFVSGVASIVRRGRLRPDESRAKAKGPSQPAGLDPVAAAVGTELGAGPRHHPRPNAGDGWEVEAALDGQPGSGSAVPVGTPPAPGDDVSGTIVGEPFLARPAVVAPADVPAGDPNEEPDDALTGHS